MKEPPIIDAEFTVVGEAPEAPAKWNGVGLPPDWPVWAWYQKVFYVVGMALWMWGAFKLAVWLEHLIGLRVLY